MQKTLSCYVNVIAIFFKWLCQYNYIDCTEIFMEIPVDFLISQCVDGQIFEKQIVKLVFPQHNTSFLIRINKN